MESEERVFIDSLLRGWWCMELEERVFIGFLFSVVGGAWNQKKESLLALSSPWLVVHGIRRKSLH